MRVRLRASPRRDPRGRPQDRPGENCARGQQIAPLESYVPTVVPREIIMGIKNPAARDLRTPKHKVGVFRPTKKGKGSDRKVCTTCLL